MDVGAPEFKKLEIEVFGRLSLRAVELVRQKAAMSGDRAVVSLHEQFAGFSRLDVPRPR